MGSTGKQLRSETRISPLTVEPLASFWVGRMGASRPQCGGHGPVLSGRSVSSFPAAAAAAQGADGAPGGGRGSFLLQNHATTLRSRVGWGEGRSRDGKGSFRETSPPPCRQPLLLRLESPEFAWL